MGSATASVLAFGAPQKTLLYREAHATRKRAVATADAPPEHPAVQRTRLSSATTQRRHYQFSRAMRITTGGGGNAFRVLAPDEVSHLAGDHVIRPPARFTPCPPPGMQPFATTPMTESMHVTDPDVDDWNTASTLKQMADGDANEGADGGVDDLSMSDDVPPTTRESTAVVS
jgi:hypothetical protein